MRYLASFAVAGATLLFAFSTSAPSHEGRLALGERKIAPNEYHASLNRAGLQAPNRAQNLRTYFDATGIRVHGRSAPDELLSLSLVGVGRGSALVPLPPGEVTSEGAQVEIRREGIVEWYQNSAAGLEQGFTLAKRPAGDGLLRVELSVKGAAAFPSEDAVIFAVGSGRRLRYDKLVAIDASGRELPARLFVPDPGRVRIEVDDDQAAYPLVIDPLLTNAADGVLDGGGPHVTSIGDVNADGYDDVMVGHHQGLVFLGSALGIASGGWETAATNLDGHSGGKGSMAGVGDFDGDGYDDVIMSFFFAYLDGGIADVWRGGPSGIQTPNHNHIHAGLMSDGYTYGGFSSIASAGDVNGDGYDDVILAARRWIAPDDDQSEGVAAILHGSPAVMDSYLYIGSADTLLTFPLGYVHAAGAGDVNGDGYDDVIVGIPGNGRGAAMIFHGGPPGIASGSQPDTLLATNDFYNDFADRVAGAGDVNGDGYDDVIIGCPDLGGGAAILYMGSAAGIPESLSYYSPTAISIGPDIESSITSNAFPDFASSVAGAGDVNGDGYDDVLVGAPYYTDGEQNEGAVFVVLGSATGIAPEATNSAYARLESNQPFAYLGGDVASAGDVNGDGLADVIAAAWGYGAEGTGAALIYLGEADVDSDRVLDPADNCRTQANPQQLDADGDGFGNHCDADFDQDGATGIVDFGIFRRCFGRTAQADGGPAQDPICAESDMDGDGVVGASDLVLFRAEFSTPPG